MKPKLDIRLCRASRRTLLGLACLLLGVALLLAPVAAGARTPDSSTRGPVGPSHSGKTDSGLVAPAGTPAAPAAPELTPTPTIDVGSAIPIACDQVAQGDTRSASNHVSQYGCVPWWQETGPEKVYSLTLNNRRSVDAVISNLSVDLDIFILTSASPSSCIAYGDNSASAANLAPGTYYLVVDGYQGAAGAFQLNVWCPLSLTPTASPTPTATPTTIPGAHLRYLPILLVR